MTLKLLSVLALAACVSSTYGCAAQVGDGTGDDSQSAEGDGEDDPTQEGDEAVSADELKLGDANREGIKEPVNTPEEKAAVLAKYDFVDPGHVVPKTLLENALQYYDFNKARFENDGYMVVIDMGQHSGKERFYLIGMDSGSVTTTVVAHGSGSDPDNDGKATRFSDTNDSHMTSIGYYKTAETYTGTHGFSLKLDGLSKTNDTARARAVVMHGASYVAKGKAKQGRSWGCPAVSDREKDDLIRKLKGGALLYIDTTAGAESR